MVESRGWKKKEERKALRLIQFVDCAFFTTEFRWGLCEPIEIIFHSPFPNISDQGWT